MTLFLNAHSDRLAPGSFQQPVPVPAHQPGEPDLVQVCFNRDWLPYILGCLFQLTLSTTWDVTNQDQLNAALGAANNLILIFQMAQPGCGFKDNQFSGAPGGDEFMLRQNPDNPCELQSSVDGVTWCTWADLSKCVTPMQPGVGAPQPLPGECRKYQGAISPTNAWVLPTPVNSGDVVTVTNLNGSWTPSAFLEIWLCPDGNIFFAGVCVDHTQAFDPGAPMPSAPLNGTVLFDGTNYYDVSAAANPGTPVAVTIAPGVSNAQLIVRCNFHGGVAPAGEVLFDIQICNNVATGWTSVFNFLLNTYSFHSFSPDGAATWTAATGFIVTNNATGSIFNNDLFLDFASTTIKHIDLEYEAISFVSPASNLLRIGSGSTVVINPMVVAGSGTQHAIYDDATGVVSTEISLSLGGGGGSGTVGYKQMTVSGTGTKPSNFP